MQQSYDCLGCDGLKQILHTLESHTTADTDMKIILAKHRFVRCVTAHSLARLLIPAPLPSDIARLALLKGRDRASPNMPCLTLSIPCTDNAPCIGACSLLLCTCWQHQCKHAHSLRLGLCRYSCLCLQQSVALHPAKEEHQCDAVLAAVLIRLTESKP